MSVNFGWIRCVRHRRRLSLFAAGVLPATERAGCEAHLAVCPGCREHWEGVRRVATLFEAEVVDGASTAVPVPPALARRWRAEVRSGAGLAGGRVAPGVDWWWRWGWGTVAACWLLTALLRGLAPGVPVRGTSGGPITVRQARVALGLVPGAAGEVAANGETPRVGARPGPGASHRRTEPFVFLEA